MATTAAAQEDEGAPAPTRLQSFDPGLAFSRLLEASADEEAAASPFTGLATRVRVDPLFGTATATIPIEVPPGRNGMTPEVVARYSSNQGNGVLGMGWDLAFGSVRRHTGHGVPLDLGTLPPTYKDEVGFTLSLGGGTVELDRCLDDASPCARWGASAEEGWLDATFDQAANRWRVRDKRGRVFTYGLTPTARCGRDVVRASGTFAWHLTEIRDSNGNTIEFDYEVHRGHVYPVTVHYGANPEAGFARHTFHVTVAYDRSRADVATTWRGGFADTLAWRVASVGVWADGFNAPVRRYDFAYGQDEETGRSQLASVSLALADDTVPPPAARFTYSRSARAFGAALPLTGLGDNWVAIGGVAGLNYAGFVDIDADGRRDYLIEQADELHLYRNTSGRIRGRLSFDAAAGDTAWTAVTGDPTWGNKVLSSDQARFVDMDGDGFTDFVRAPSSCCPDPEIADCGPQWNGCAWEFHRNVDGSLQEEAQMWPGVPRTMRDLLGRGSFYIDARLLAAELVDLDGDAQADILDCTGAARVGGMHLCRMHRNNGAGFEPGRAWPVPSIDDPPAAVAASVRDPLRAYDPAWFNGTRSVPARVFKTLVDVNGDGLPDLVRSGFDSSSWRVAFNNGAGFEDVVAWPAPAAALGEETSVAAGSATTLALRDLTGDGLQDFIDARESIADPQRPWTVHVNTGSGFAAGVLWAGTEGKPVRLVRSAPEFAWVAADVVDLNGDGIEDYVERRDSDPALSYARPGLGTRAHLLVHQENGVGGACLVRYVNAHDGPRPRASDAVGGGSQLPFPAWVVEEVTTTSGFEGRGHRLTTRFGFQGPYFDAEKRRFRGFRQSIEVRVLQDGSGEGRQTLRVFAPPPYRPSVLGGAWPAEWPFREWQDGAVPSAPFKMVAVRFDSSPSGSRLQQSLTDWEAQPTGDGRVALRAVKNVESKHGSGSSVVKEVTRTLRYDRLGNVVEETVAGDDVTPIRSVASYAGYACSGPGCPESFCPGQPIAVATFAASGTVHTWRTFTYDGLCNLLRISSYLSPEGTFSLSRTLEVEYDRAADAAAATGQPTALVDVQGNRTELRYDCRDRGTGEDTYALFPCSVTNALGHETLRSYDVRWGKLLRVVDANGAQTRVEYDGLGRTRSVYKPLDSFPWRAFRYTFGAAGSPPRPSRVESRIREPNASSGDRRVVTFFDGLGRALQRKQRQYVDAVAVTVVHDAVTFDDVGRVAARFVPFPATAEALDTYEIPPSDAAATSFHYDALDRLTVSRNAAGSLRTVDRSVAGREVTYDENFNECMNPTGKTATCPGKQTIETRDALGRVVSVEVRQGGSPSVRTSHAYDEFGRLLRTTHLDVISGHSALTEFTYDRWGRRTAMREPDSGLWRYRYDLRGNLIFQDDPETGQHLEFCYDALNRVTRKLYLSGDEFSSAAAYELQCGHSAPPLPFVLYGYDAATERGCAGNGLGRLCAVSEQREDGTADTWFSYDARGRVVAEAVERAVTVLGTPRLGSYTFRYEYDVADRLIAVNYPTDSLASSERLTHAFDDLGQPRSLASPTQVYAGSLAYDRFGRLLRWTDGSGLRHRRAYTDASGNFRLAFLEVSDATGNPVQGLSYPAREYDVAGNLKRVVDYVQTPGAVTNNSWTYAYDGLGRMTRAQRGGETAVPFVHDGLGNLLVGNRLSFVHSNAAHPHQVSAVIGSATPPAYDANGALARIPSTTAGVGRTLAYDADGRLERVSTEDGRTVRSVYNYRGERVVRVVDEGLPTQSVTFFYGRWFEVSDATLTRNVFLGDRLIAVSPVSAPPGLSVASVAEGPEVTLLARSLGGASPGQSPIYPTFGFGSRATALVAALLLLSVVALRRLPGEVRVGLFGKVRRRRVAILLLPLGLSLTPLPLARPVWAGGSGGGGICLSCAPRRPVYFVSTDHQGSTTMLTCHAQGAGCPDRSVFRYYRYDPYGGGQAWDGRGAAVALQDGPTERLYTGQRWDAPARLYDFKARFYDPVLARFLTLDPVRESMNPYAYARWNPVTFSDPSGLFSALTAALEFQMGASACGGAAGCNATLSGLQAANHYTGATGGFAQDGPFTASGTVVASLPPGVAEQALEGLGGALSAASQSAGGAALSAADAAGSTDAGSPTFTTAPFTATALIPKSLGELVALPMTLLGFVMFHAASGFEPPVQVTYEGITAFYFGGNPSGYLTLGHAIWGLSSTYADLVHHGAPSAAAAGYLQHEFGHITQYQVLGATFLALYLAQFPAAVALLQLPFRFNALENFFLDGAPSTYDLDKAAEQGA
jgi:RHS repeat-associated protein